VFRFSYRPVHIVSDQFIESWLNPLMKT